MWKKKNLKWGLRSSPVPSLTAGVFKKQREEEEEKTWDNHQCLRYLSSKRLKAHIAYNWIWFALPASVREIKGKHKNPHDSFSSSWQVRPNRSWKEYLRRKPPRLLTQTAGNDSRGEQWTHNIKTEIIMAVFRICLLFLHHQRKEVKVALGSSMMKMQQTKKKTLHWNSST